MARMLREDFTCFVCWIILIINCLETSFGQTTENSVLRYVCNETLSTTPSAFCYFLAPPIGQTIVGTPTTEFPGAKFTCNGTAAADTSNPACIYLQPPGPNNLFTGYLVAGLQYQCKGTTAPVYNPFCTYPSGPAGNVLTGVPLADVPADPLYWFHCKGRDTSFVNTDCTSYSEAVNQVFVGSAPTTPADFVCQGERLKVPSPTCRYTLAEDGSYNGTLIVDSTYRVDATYLWISIGIGGGLVLILLIALIYFICQYQKEHKHVRKLRAGNVTVLEEITKTSTNDLLSTEDESSFIDDIPTRSPPIAVQTARKDLPPGYPPAPEVTNVRVPTDRHNRALDDTRRPGPSSINGDDRRRALSPSGREPRERYEYEPERPRKTSQAEPRPRRSQYDEEVSRYKSPRRREDEFETMSSQMPRNRDVRPSKKTRSIPDLDRIDEVDHNDRKRIPPTGWSYLPQPVDVYHGNMPKAQLANSRDNRRERTSEKKDNRNDGFILRGHSADHLEDRRPERAKSPVGEEREWSRDAGNRRSRSSDVGGRRTGDPKRDAYGRPYY